MQLIAHLEIISNHNAFCCWQADFYADRLAQPCRCYVNTLECTVTIVLCSNVQYCMWLCYVVMIQVFFNYLFYWCHFVSVLCSTSGSNRVYMSSTSTVMPGSCLRSNVMAGTLGLRSISGVVYGNYWSIFGF